MAVLYTEAVVRRGMPVTDFVGLSSSRIAKRLGLWPRKGSLQVGADADVTVIDPGRSGTFRLEDLHTVDYSIWDGYAYTGAPVITIARGEVVVQDGAFAGGPPAGSFLHRKGRARAGGAAAR